MMLDTRIAMGVQPLDVGAAIGRGYQLRDLAAQADERQLDTQLKQQAVKKQATLGDLYRGAIGADGKIDRAKITQGVVQAGYGADLPEMQKKWSEAEQLEIENLTKNGDRMMKTFDYAGKAIGSLLSNPNATADDVVRQISGMVSAGLMDQQEGARFAREVPGDPAQLRQYLMQKAAQAQQAKDMLATALPQLKEINLGGHTQLVDTNPMTNPQAVGQRLDRSATIGEKESARHNRASEGLTARGQNIADSRARETTAATMSRAFEVTGPDGKPMLVQQDKAGNIRPVQGYTPKAGAGAGPGKPLPTAALKMVQEGKDAIGTASSINADLGTIAQQITDGKLSFGPVSNLVNAGRNAAGASTEQSRNFASFKASLEKLRNDSLRLNKGVQTDGDAQRAWNELFQNINDTRLVQQRLGEIQRINDRGVQLRQLDIDGVLQNYGRDPMDTSAYASQPSALSGGGATPAPRATAANPSIDALLEKYK